MADYSQAKREEDWEKAGYSYVDPYDPQQEEDFSEYEEYWAKRDEYHRLGDWLMEARERLVMKDTQTYAKWRRFLKARQHG